jgi:predicted helicase
VFNLRGNQRTSGELSKKEGGKIFGSGSRTPVSITLLIKNPNAKNNKTTIYYHDIGDYLSRKEKLSIIKRFGTVDNPEIDWEIITPNEEGDWINQRNAAFDTFIKITPQKKFDIKCNSFFVTYSLGLGSSRDAWVYNSSSSSVAKNMGVTIYFYNEQVNVYQKYLKNSSNFDFSQIQDNNPKKLSWSSSLLSHACRSIKAVFDKDNIIISYYRLFCKQYLYYEKIFNHRQGQLPKLFPLNKTENFVICIPAPGGKKEFSAIITDCIPDLHLKGDSQCFPLYYYEEIGDQKNRGENTSQILLNTDKPEKLNKFIKRDGISDFIFEKAKEQYKDYGLTKEDIFYYVYGIFHSPDYRNTFSNDLKKMLPKIPLVDNVSDFKSFSMAGRKLADLHLNYESVPPYLDVKVTGTEVEYFVVNKMRFPKKDQKNTIIYNSKITISGIPDKAYQYIVNGKSAIEWIMERYQIKTDSDSGITNDPNDWAKELGNPRYILDLLLSIINLSVQTVGVIDRLPELQFELKRFEEISLKNQSLIDLSISSHIYESKLSQ